MSNADQTAAFLKKAFVRERRAMTGLDVRRVTAVCLSLLLAALVIDAAFALSVHALLTTRLLLSAALGGGVIFCVLRHRRRHFQPGRVALAAQKRIGVSNDRLLNALAFSTPSGQAGSTDLQELAIRLAEDLAPDLDINGLVPVKRVRRSRMRFMGLLLGICLLILLWPTPFRAAALRLRDPLGDHPPFTRLSFEVALSPEQPHAGHDAQIHVTVQGPKLPASAQIVMQASDGTRRRADLFPTGGQEDQTGFRLSLKNLQQGFDFHVDTPEGRSDWHTLAVLPIPLFEQVHATITPPAYTRWEPESKRLQDAGLEALKGSTARLQITSNLPLSHVELLHIQDGEETRTRHQPLAKHPEMAEVELPILQDGAYQLELFAQDGTPGNHLWEGSITAISDQPPTVSLDAVDTQNILPDNWPLDLSATITDDVGIGELRARLGAEGSDSQLVPLAVAEEPPPTRLQINEKIDLASLGLTAGTTLRYMVEARDNLPPDGQWSVSNLGIVHIVPEEVYRDFFRQQYQAEQIMEEIQSVRDELTSLRDQKNQLLDELTALQEKTDPTREDLQQMQVQRQALQDFQNRSAELQQWISNRLDFDTLYAFEEPYRDWLQDLSEGLEGQQRDAAALHNSLPDPLPASSPDFAENMERFRNNTDPFPPNPGDPVSGEQLAQDLETLEQISDFMHQTQRIQELAKAQRELADQLDLVQRDATQSEKDKQDSLKNLSEQQEKLKKELDDIQKELSQQEPALQENLPELAGQCQGLLQGMNGLQIPGDQSRAAEEAAQGRGSSAEQFANMAAGKLETLAGMAEQAEGACKGSGGSCPSLSGDQFAESISQMLEAMQAGPSPLPGNIPALPGIGKTGMGRGGLNSTLGMIGPQYPIRGTNTSTFELSGRRAGDGKGPGVSEIVSDADGPGEVTPENMLDLKGNATRIPGIPLRLQPLVNAYFERLSKDRFQE